MDQLEAYVKSRRAFFNQKQYQTCYEFTNYIGTVFGIQRKLEEGKIKLSKLYLVNFIYNEHVFFIQGDQVLHSFRDKFQPRKNRKPATRKALMARDLAAIARSFNMKVFMLKSGDGFDRVQARDLNKYFAKDPTALRIWECRITKNIGKGET